VVRRSLVEEATFGVRIALGVLAPTDFALVGGRVRQQRLFVGTAHGSNLYPRPRTVNRCFGLPGSGSIFARNRFTCTSSVLVSPT